MGPDQDTQAPHSGRVIAMVIAFALVANWLATALEVERGAFVVPPETPWRTVYSLRFDTASIGLRCLSWVAFMGTAAVALAAGALQRLSRPCRWGLMTVVLGSWLWYGISVGCRGPLQLLHEVFNPTGPFLWYLLLGVAVPYLRGTWKPIEYAAGLIAFLSIGFAVRHVLRRHGYPDVDGFSPVHYYIACLFWFGSYFFLKHTSDSYRNLALRSAPLLVCLIASIAALRRGWTVLILLTVLAFFWRRHNRRSTSGPLAIRIVIYAITTGVAVLALGGVLALAVPDAVGRLQERVSEDTRSRQLRVFFEQNSLMDLLIGRGPYATYEFGGEKEYRWIDNQYLWILMVAGLPFLVAYCTIIFGALKKPKQGLDDEIGFACRVLLVLWALSLGGVSTFNSVMANSTNFFVALVAGRLWHVRTGGMKLATTSIERGTNALWPVRTVGMIARSKLPLPHTRRLPQQSI